jgi:hypothetical protein
MIFRKSGMMPAGAKLDDAVRPIVISGPAGMDNGTDPDRLPAPDYEPDFPIPMVTKR